MNYYDDVDANCLGVEFVKTNNSKVIQGDLRRKSTWKQFDDNSFDLITSFGVLHWLINLNMCFSEMWRILKPNGKMFHLLWHEDNYTSNNLNEIINNEPFRLTKSMLKLNQNTYDELLQKHNFKNEIKIIKHLDDLKFIAAVSYKNDI